MNTKDDRLSSLSDDLVIKILSYNNDTKQAVRTSILSSRWKTIWKSIPLFDLSSDYFTSRPHEVTRYLSSRNNEIELSSVELSVGEFSQAFVKTVVDYAFSHNVQKMTIIWSGGWHNKIPNFLFMSRSLKDLTFISTTRYLNQPEIKSSMDLPALTSLHLENVILDNQNPDEYGGLFSKFLNLKNLTLFKCSIHDHNPFISLSEFSNLTPENGLYSFANVVAPHLKNLTVVDCQGRLKVYAPELSSLMYEVPCFENFIANGVSCLERVDFYMCPYEEDDGDAIIKILQQFHNVKYLTIGLEIVEILKSYVDELSDLPSSFGKLMSLKIFPRKEKGKKKVKIPRQVKNFFLGASPNAVVSIYSRKEVKTLKDATSAQKILPKLQGFQWFLLSVILYATIIWFFGAMLHILDGYVIRLSNM
ncbi:F-box protein At5g03100-like [Rutidosis leptorrhynchoides]|uniref:F-box protein At5g03100-like n=1 Tax=Rutidosis leptorrhynchoides TaxID=125765 RepID=UPI003A99E490